ncbi:group 1 glycosyl transferase [Vibrio caribbeanicus]|uniref:Group 1 glycosyl transferase n=1 Tax=Vibrio caribbeanicus TaxID=701175 RepID=A0ACC4NSJ7_9VIBR|nr:glycosyltransferase family 4 protein [Vibrio caribbeanicus]KHD23456.1 group 1 glycosyl transferase [Vibrio caribbeanicus]
MKIALVHMRHAETGGTELFLNQLSRYLAEKGEEVTIICRTHVAPSHPNIKFVKLNSFTIGKAHRIWKFAKDVEKHITQNQYDFVYGLGKTWTHDMLRIGGGTHVHFVESMKKGKLKLKDRAAIAIERKAMAKGAYKHVVANSHKSAQEIHEAYQVPKEKISVIHNFVDTTRFDKERVIERSKQLEKEIGLERSKPVYLFLGSGYERKGLKKAIKALSMLEFKATLLIVGRENHEADYKSYAEELGVLAQCKFLGVQSEAELFFAMADCYVLPTLYEPFGFTAIEALSCGIPVITTENCGAKEVLRPEVSTVVSSEVNPSDIAQAMKHWVNVEDKVELTRQCRSLALTLDVEAVMEQNYQQILDVYNAN